MMIVPSFQLPVSSSELLADWLTGNWKLETNTDTQFDIPNARAITLDEFALAADAYPEWLREQARRRHSNQAPSREPRCYFLPDEPGEIRASVDRLVSAVPLKLPYLRRSIRSASAVLRAYECAR